MKKKRTGIVGWAVTTGLVGAFLLTANILLSTTFKDIICTVLGDRGRLELISEEGSRFSLDEGITDKASAKANGSKVTVEICEEGFTLLKNKNNNALPLAKNAKVTLFGKSSADVLIGGSGSGAASKDGMIDIFTSLEKAGFSYNPTMKAFYADESKSGKGRDDYSADLDSGKALELKESFVGETDISAYTDDLWASCDNYKDAALIVISRTGGEGHDLPRNDTDHILKLRPAEKDLINAVKSKGFGKVVLLLNTASAMELGDVEKDDGVDAILWIGYAGTSGLEAVGEVLLGETLDGVKFSPSGKTVDIYPADFTKDPTWNNFGGNVGVVTREIRGKTLSVSGDCYFTDTARGPVDSGSYFADYEEGIFYGYRYYETAHADGYINYDEAVIYPFGYGLSYTNFSWELKNKSKIPTTLEKNTKMTFEVEVTNTGTYPGRDTVELYVTPHYNVGGLDKVAKLLVGFDKTEILQPGEKETVKITVDSPYSYASYDYLGITGQKGYVVEAGNDYVFTLGTDSHHTKDMSDATITASIASDIRYAEDPVTGNEVKNLYTDNANADYNCDTQLGSILHRNDFAGTWPQTRLESEKVIGGEQVKENWHITSDWISHITDYSPNPNNPVEVTEMPVTNQDNGVKFTDLVGLDYDDPLWDKFVDQLTVQEMRDLVNKGAFQTDYIQRLGVPPTDNSDGPVGWVNFMDKETFKGTCSYCNEVVIASTWNVDRLYDMGRAIGNEGLVGTTQLERNKPYTGWYAPGINIHRSPFAGRNFEYYSEDPLLSGVLAASLSKGTWSKGCYTTIKHFAVNETETHRMGLITWLTEQSLREVYLKGFEIAMKGGIGDTMSHEYFGEEKAVKPVSIMTSFNMIGIKWTGGDYRLCTNILREEWGFEGFVICDFNTCSHMVEKDMFYAGNDLNLESAGVMVWEPNANDPKDVYVLKSCSKNILYVIANSNAVRGQFKVHLPKWQVGMYIGTGVVFAGLVAWGVLVFLRFFKRRKQASVEVQ